MIPFDSKADDLTDYAEECRKLWTEQRSVDDENLGLYLQRYDVPITDPGQNRPRGEGANQDLEAVSLGRGGLIVDQDVHLISVMWSYRMNPAGTSPKAVDHASSLERWMDGCAIRMEELAPEPQLPKLRKDLILYDRGILCTFPVPDAWSGGRFNRGKDESDKDYEERYEMELRRKFPMAWRWWSAPDCYFRWFGDDYTIIRYRSMKVGEILASYPDTAENLKSSYQAGRHDLASTVDVAEYLSSDWYGMVVKDSSDELRKWKHHMGVNPGVLFSGNAMPENEHVRWGGALYHARHVLKAHDEAVSNLLTNLRRDTRALTVIWHDPEMESGGEARGRPKKINVPPGAQVDLWAGKEDLKRVGSAASNTDYGPVLQELARSEEDIGLRRVFMGQVKSDVTGTATRLVGEFAQLEMNDISQGIRTGARKVGIRMLHVPQALEKAVEELRQDSPPDKVYVRHEDKEKGTMEIAIGPSDARNYDDLVQARWELQTPSDERAMADMLRLLIEEIPGAEPILDVWRARERLGYEDPQAITRSLWRQRARNSPQAIEMVMQQVAERLAGQIAGEREDLTPEDVMALEGMGFDEEMLNAIMGQQAPPAPMPQGGESLVPSENAMREGEQVAVQEPRV